MTQFITYKEGWNRLKSAVEGVRRSEEHERDEMCKGGIDPGRPKIYIENLQHLMKKIEKEMQ